jgi:hypothetical protein
MTKLSKVTGVPTNTLKNYHDDERLPAAPVLMQIARTTGADINWLLLGGDVHKQLRSAKTLRIELPPMNIQFRLSDVDDDPEEVTIEYNNESEDRGIDNSEGSRRDSRSEGENRLQRPGRNSSPRPSQTRPKRESN